MKLQKLLLSIAFAVVALCAYGESSTDLFAYSINTDEDGDSEGTCTLIHADFTKISGEVTIPQAVTIITKDGITTYEKLYQVSAIGETAFMGCSNMTSITIPRTIKKIGSSAFMGCENLRDVMVDWTTPLPCDDRTALHQSAFSLMKVDLADCTLHVPSGTGGLYRAADVWKLFGTIDDPAYKIVNNVLVSYHGLGGDVVIPDNMGITSIGEQAFFDNQLITSVVIPNGVTEIGRYAFAHSHNLTSITLPNTLKSIDAAAFFGCHKLGPVTIPSSVTSIQPDAFGACEMLSSINVDTGNTNYTSDSGILYDKNKTTLHTYPAGKNGSTFSIPTSVKNIGDLAFYGCNKLSTIAIHSSVSSIGFAAFGLCNNLTAINVDAGNVAYLSDSGVLYNKNKTTLIRYPVKKNGSEFNIPSTVKTIENSAFSHTSLVSVTIPNTVTTIGGSAFYYCENLTSLTIPASVESIGSEAFWVCRGLKDVSVSWATPLSVPDNIFLIVNTSAIKLHVPAGTKALYQSANVWKTFGTIIDDGTVVNTLSVSTPSLDFTADGKQKMFNITSNTSWTISSNSLWLTVSPSSGSNNTAVTVTATANTSPAQRTDTITVNGEGVPAQKIIITQAAATSTLSVSPSLLNFVSAGEQKTFTVTSNINWTAISDASWLTLGDLNGDGLINKDDISNEGDITVTATANTSDSLRTATITVNGPGATTQTISVTQAAATTTPATLSVSTSSLSFVADGEQKTFTITSNTNWEIDSSDLWLTVSAVSGSKDSMIIVTAAPNTGDIQRTATITISGSGVEAQTINIMQMAIGTPILVPEETQPVDEKGNGKFSLSLSISSTATLTGSFEIQFPEGMTLDEELTVLSVELSGSFMLSFTFKGNNTWLIEIKSRGLRSNTSALYRKIMDIAYKANTIMEIGTYEAAITNLDFKLNDDTQIKEDLLSVSLHIDKNPTSVENIHNAPFFAYFVGEMLKIDSQQAESIAVYSITGTKLYAGIKNIGVFEIPFSTQKGKIFIIKGSKSGSIKIAK